MKRLSIAFALAATCFALAAQAQSIRVYAEGETPSQAELVRILAGEDADEDKGAGRGLRVIEAAPERRAARVRASTAPAAARPSAIAVPVRFSFNSELIAREAIAQLDAIAEAIKALPFERTVIIEGHTDAHGSPEINYELSLKRAHTVRMYFVRVHGIAAGKLMAVGKGASVPLVRADPYSPENRRVQFRAG